MKEDMSSPLLLSAIVTVQIAALLSNDNHVLSLRDVTGATVLHWAALRGVCLCM